MILLISFHSVFDGDETVAMIVDKAAENAGITEVMHTTNFASEPKI